MTMNAAMKRLDYPLCPYCGNRVTGFCPAGGDTSKATLYCMSGQCRGASLGGDLNGYDIRFTDLKTPYGGIRRNFLSKVALSAGLFLLRLASPARATDPAATL